jgi:hypothetical protein
LQYRLFDLVREGREVTVEAVKQVALGLVRCEVADQGGGATIGVLFDGNKRVTRVHRSYIEPDDDGAKAK